MVVVKHSGLIAVSLWRKRNRGRITEPAWQRIENASVCRTEAGKDWLLPLNAPIGRGGRWQSGLPPGSASGMSA